MDIYQLVEKLSGEIASNKAVVIVDDERLVVGEVLDNTFQLNETGIALVATLSSNPTSSATRKRARNSDGTLKGDDPSTPHINEAWENGDD